jgi:hypothetical protein
MNNNFYPLDREKILNLIDVSKSDPFRGYNWSFLDGDYGFSY